MECKDAVQSVEDIETPSGEERPLPFARTGRDLRVVRITAGTAPWVRQISENLFTDVMPVWSPDGQRIAFITNHDDSWSIYSVHPYPGESQAEYIASLGAESADWQRFKLAWAAQVVRLPESE